MENFTDYLFWSIIVLTIICFVLGWLFGKKFVLNKVKNSDFADTDIENQIKRYEKKRKIWSFLFIAYLVVQIVIKISLHRAGDVYIYSLMPVFAWFLFYYAGIYRYLKSLK
ncbi:MAG: hypothetical protein UHK52_03210 [Bacteroidales bacterium]|jgi:hypothetical protein|nr:hypothetical protein [Bacteroidales bacterium]